MIKLDTNSENELIKLLESKNIGLEGNIIKLFESDNDVFKNYLKVCGDKDKDSRRKRLEITKKVQIQNNELSNLNEQNQKMMEDLQIKIDEIESIIFFSFFYFIFIFIFVPISFFSQVILNLCSSKIATQIFNPKPVPDSVCPSFLMYGLRRWSKSSCVIPLPLS